MKPRTLKKPRKFDSKLCEHTQTPDSWEDYMKWRLHHWKTHEQTQCPNCGAWKVWVKRDA